MKTIAIVGGGVGGLELATRLGRSLGRKGQARVVLLDRAPAYFWKPLLHAVAAGSIDSDVHTIDYLKQAQDNGFEFVCGDVTGLDRSARRLTVRRHALAHGPELVLAYDQLVLSFGAVTNFFGVPGAQQHALSLDSVAQADTFRQRLLGLCAAAGDGPRAAVPANQHAPLVDIVIVGAGATGVELAADLRHTIATLARMGVCQLDFQRDVRIRIVERASRLLPGLDASISSAAAERLRHIGIDICTDTAVASVTDSAVLATDGRIFPASITVWAAGVQGPALATQLGLALNRNRQVLVDESLQSLDDEHVFAMGDCAAITQAGRSVMVPPSAQAARQQAIFLAQQMVRPVVQNFGQNFGQHLGQQPTRAAFQYRDYGALVSLGPFGTVGVLLRALGMRRLFVEGLLARWLYGASYQRYVLANVGVLGMAGHVLGRWARARTATGVKWH